MDVYNGMIFNHQTWKMYIEKNNLHKKGEKKDSVFLESFLDMNKKGN